MREKEEARVKYEVEPCGNIMLRHVVRHTLEPSFLEVVKFHPDDVTCGERERAA